MNDEAATAERNTERDAKAGEARDPQARTLGLARWVQVAFMVFFAFSFWLIDKVLLLLGSSLLPLIWRNASEPNATLVSALSAAAAAGLTFYLYKHEKVNRMTNEVVGELAKVTWPSRKETYTSSIVVVVTSVIAAAILGGFDTVWSAITDLIYKV